MATDANCIFCKIGKGDIPAKRVGESEMALVFPDLNPQAPTHLLIIPKQHYASLAHTGEAEDALLGHLLAVARSTAAALGLDKSGYRLVINSGAHGGQTVHHLHVHLLAGRQMTWPPG